MYCKNCGKEIADDSTFCSFCGIKQVAQADDIKVVHGVSDEKYTPSTEDNEDEKSKVGCLIIAFVAVFVVAVLIACVVVLFGEVDNGNSNASDYGSTSQKDYVRDARSSDLIANYTKIDNWFEADDYYLKLQSQEKITGLKIKVTYMTSGGKTLKTEEIYVGTVVPGNEYKFELTQSGMDPDDLDKTSKFSLRVISGKVVE